MTLSERQTIFSINFAKLVLWGNEQRGYKVRIDEVKRSESQQIMYYQGLALDASNGYGEPGEPRFQLVHSKDLVRTRTMFTKHWDRLAGDLILDIDGKYQTETEAYTALGEHWKSLHKDNAWGGDWTGFPDGGHFQMGG